MKRSKETKAERTRRLKRRNTLIKMANKFHTDFDFKVYLMVQGRNRRYVYSSNGTNTSWPPALSDMVSDYAPHFGHRLPNVQLEGYPLPSIYTPEGLESKDKRGEVIPE